MTPRSHFERLRRRLRPARPIRHVLLHQPGKVGSTSLQDSFRATAPELEIHHAHFISAPYRQFFEALVRLGDAPDAMISALAPHRRAGAQMRGLLEASRPEELCVVCGFREPVGHAVSSFFQNLQRIVPDASDAAVALPVRLERASAAFSQAYRDARRAEELNTFWAHYAHWLLIGSSLRWYELELFEPYGLDIYDVRLRGRDLVDLRHEGVRIILYRFESFADVRDEIVGRVTGRAPKLVDANVSDRKPYGELLRAFRDGFQPPGDMEEIFREARFTRHAYSSRLEALRARVAPRRHRSRAMPVVDLSRTQRAAESDQ